MTVTGVLLVLAAVPGSAVVPVGLFKLYRTWSKKRQKAQRSVPVEPTRIDKFWLSVGCYLRKRRERKMLEEVGWESRMAGGPSRQ